jgi:hypothetical protein
MGQTYHLNELIPLWTEISHLNKLMRLWTETCHLNELLRYGLKPAILMN